jgi:hypothetical protein
MKKKIIVALVLAAVISGSIYAQEDEGEKERAKNRISLSVGIVGGELSYERVFTPYLSVLGQVSYNNIILADSLSFAAKGRVYPFGGTFYLDLGIGFSYGYNITTELAQFMADMTLMMLSFGLYALSPDYQARSYDEAQREGGFFLQPGMGWNIDVGKTDGFFLPISMGLDIRFSETMTIIPFLRLGVSYAF